MMLKSLIIVLVLITNLLLFVKSQSDEEVRYYTNLIKTEIEKSKTQKGPTDASDYTPKSKKITAFGSFDYIVIGAGSAGAVVASRLSEIPENRVLLIEAGGQENNFTDIPAVSYYLLNSEFTWNFKTVPQTNSCLGMVNQQCNYPRGRGLGGSSIINSLNYVRGNKHDYNSWAEQGNPGWSYNEVLPIFLKSENANFVHDSIYHRQGGQMNVEHENPNNVEYFAFLEANFEKNRTFIDYNGAEQIGVSQVQFNTVNGKRDSSNKAFLTPAYNRPNLKIMTWSYVTKININRNTKRAYGVTFSYKSKLRFARAKKEVILSAGAFHSPQLLMLSGVGPAKELKKHKIPVIQSLAVGENLQDHYGYLALLFQTNSSKPILSLEDQVKQYLTDSGDLTFAINSQGVSWFQTKLEKVPNYPDIEVIMVTSNNTNSIVKEFNNYNNDTYEEIWAHVDPTKSFTTSLLLMHPKSRGSVKLQSSSPYVFPLIDTNFYSDVQNQDLDTMYEGIQVVLDLINTTAFRRINATLLPASHPKCKQLDFKSKAYWYCQLKYLTIPFYHPVGTCKMGPDPYFGGAVVDNELKVHGIRNLRVADASIMPQSITGHTHAPTVMIGEKAAELIIKKSKHESKSRAFERMRMATSKSGSKIINSIVVNKYLYT